MVADSSKKYFLVFVSLAVLLSLLSTAAEGQTLGGIWKGTLTQNAGGCFPVYYIEVQLNFSGDSVYGATYHYSHNSNYVKKKYSGRYNSSTKNLRLSEGVVSTFKIPPDCTPCIKNYDLWYSRNSDKETLSGGWNGKVLNTTLNCQPGQLVLTRVKESAFAEIPEIEVDTGNIQLSFYDNGIVDGDSISVIANNKTIVSNQRLSTQAFTLTIRIDKDTPFQEIEMVAQNEGTISPNTAYLLVTAGTIKHRLYLSSSLNKSSKVRFVYERDLSTKKSI